MKKIVLAVLVAVVSIGVLFTASASAAKNNVNYRGGENVTLEQSKTINGAYYTSGDTVTIAGTVKGDLYCAGRTIFVTGTVEGDVFCAGQNVKISGNIDGNIRVAGQTVTIDGTTSRNVTAFGDVVDIAKTALIGRDLNGASNTVTVDGRIGRDVTIGGNTISILGTVGRDLGVTSENLSINEGAAVLGWVRYTSENEAAIASGTVKGEVKYTKQENKDTERNAAADAVSLFIYKLLAFIVLSLGIVLLFPQHVHAISTIGVRRLGMSVLVGVFMLLAVPILLFILAITVIGLPFTVLLGLMWIIALILSGPLFAYYVGRLLLRKQTNNAIWSMLAGTGVVAILLIIPVINIFVGLMTLVVGMGTLGMYILSRLQKPHYTLK